MSTSTGGVSRGLEGVIAAETRLSHVDGEAGELIIGGYALDEVAGRATFEELCYVLWQLALGKDGEPPNQSELKALRDQIGAHSESYLKR